MSRKLWKFHGGVHPPFHKDDSTQLPSRAAGIPKQLIIPLHQHIGGNAEPLVEIGDYVFKAQLIGQMSEYTLGANIHAPTSGIVSAIEERPVPHHSGLNGLCIIYSCGKQKQNHFGI